MVLGKLPVPGRLTNLDQIRTRVYCPCSGCGWGLFANLISRLSFLFSFSLSWRLAARYRLKYCLKGPLNPKQARFFDSLRNRIFMSENIICT